MARVGFIMDPIAQISPHKDTSFRLSLGAPARCHELRYFELSDL